MSPVRVRLSLLVVAALFAATLFGCKTSSASKDNTNAQKGQAAEKVSLNGAGATFPFPLYSKWMSEYNKLHPHVQINYQSIGSGGGIRQVTAGTVDFGATDAPMDAASAKKARGTLHHIPTTLGAVTISFNVSGLSRLQLDGQTIADIFLGKVTKWNDARIKASNPDVTLPDQGITVVYRSDGSGTTAVITDYLAKVEPAFRERVGVGKAVRWPTGLGAKGNEGVTGQLKVTPGAIGYIELAYAAQNRLAMVAVKNKSGHFVEPTVAAISAAAAGVELPESLHTSLADPSGEGAYPIASFTYILAHQDAEDRTKGEALARFLWWAIHDGQQFSADLHYATLPPAVVAKVEQRLRGLTFGGKALLSKL